MNDNVILYSNAWGSGKSKKITELKENIILIVAQNNKQLEQLYMDLCFFNHSYTILKFPEYDQEPFEELRISPKIISERVNTLSYLSKNDNINDKLIVITTPYALTKKIVPKEVFIENIYTINTNTSYSRSYLLDLLDKLGYLAVEVVRGKGEFCTRGGVIDIYPMNLESPIRLDFFGETVESIYSFDISSFKKIDILDKVELYPASTEVLISLDELISITNINDYIKEKLNNFGKFAGVHWLVHNIYHSSTLLDYFPNKPTMIFFEENWEILFKEVYSYVKGNTIESNCLYSLEEFIDIEIIKQTISPLKKYIFNDFISSDRSISCDYKGIASFLSIRKGNIYKDLSQAIEEIKVLINNKYNVVLFVESERFIIMIKNFCRDHELSINEITNIKNIKKSFSGLYLHPHSATGGFIDDKSKFAMITDEDIFGFIKKRNIPKPKDAFNTTISDLEINDFVVHQDYGIGIYRGLKHMILGGIQGDYLEILYDKQEILYVPIESISQIQKYIGIGDQKPKLSNLQTNTWSKLKSSAKSKAKAIAHDLLKLYTDRLCIKGFSYKDNSLLLKEFEERFEYDETEDQITAIHDVYADMEKEIPMDRLVCGDVGFGKTEVAMRAASKAVFNGKQVAVLVPTTVLARQHYYTFINRFSDMPVKIDYISRMRTATEIKDIRNSVSEGKIDILIGTHRILSSDILFKDLGLLIIDEEQRFGVAHKEKISTMRNSLDVLCLSATPIPRTLQLSLSGVREISVIQTPPSNRAEVAIKVISGFDEISSPLTKELERSGQIFFLHNRIETLPLVLSNLQRIVPNAKISVVHGKTSPKVLDTTLNDFYSGNIDILLSTTIIENGIDIPNVNAIFINEAAHFGLSQLYQLKGRVGRGERKGYCYLIVSNINSLSPIAKKRLSIIQQLSDLGSGLKIAMHDLQLRGGGEMLGASQSGFITKVGYELFLKMISEAVAELRKDHNTGVDTELITLFPHYIAAEYIEDPKARLDYYKLFSDISSIEEMNDLLNQMSQLYGLIRDETTNLAYIMVIKNVSKKLGVTKISLLPKLSKILFEETTKLDPQKILIELNNKKLKFYFSEKNELSISFECDNILKDMADIICKFKLLLNN